MTLERINRKVLAVGPSGCGKSYALQHLFTSREPRVLAIDPNAEKLEQLPDALQVFGWEQLREALRYVAPQPRWTITACLDPDHFPALARLLVPTITSAETTSYAREVGGIVLECGEAALLAPSGCTPPAVKAIWTRGRHFLVSPYMATQSAAQCDVMVASSADYLLLFQTLGAADLERIRTVTSRAIAERVKRLERFHFLCVDKNRGQVAHAIVDEGTRQARVLESLNFDGEPLEAAPVPPVQRSRKDARALPR